MKAAAWLAEEGLPAGDGALSVPVTVLTLSSRRRSCCLVGERRAEGRSPALASMDISRKRASRVTGSGKWLEKTHETRRTSPT